MRREVLYVPMRREVLYDGAVVCGAVALAGFDTLDPQGSTRALGGLTTVILAATALCLIWRRRTPVTVGWIAVAAALAMAAVEWTSPGTLLRADPDPEAGPWLPPIAPFAAYAVMAFGRDRRMAWLTIGTLTVAVAGLTAMSGQPTGLPRYGQYLMSLLCVGVPALLGTYAAARRRLLDALRERAERAEREQHLLAEQARAEERARLAADMHDVITHRVSLMVLQAGALSMTTEDEAVRRAAESVRDTGCTALEELRDLVGLLRDADRGGGAGPVDVPAPVPDLTPLAAESRAVGVDVELVEQGSPTLVSPVVGRTAYRIVQEALTNTRKHAPGARARVELRYRPDGVRLRVTNTAATRRPDPALTGPGAGSGLAGLRERVDLIGGVLHADPEPDGGFRVDVVLPAQVSPAGREEAA